MTDLVAVHPIPRPNGLPVETADSTLIDACRDYLMGERNEFVAVKLGVTVNEFYQMARSPQWRLLQNQFRDEFVATTGGRMVRLEQKLLDKIEGYIDHGIECYTLEGEKYTRQLYPKECVSIAGMLAETNKRIDQLREGDVDRRKFDGEEWRRKLEQIARAAGAKEIEGQRTA